MVKLLGLGVVLFLILIALIAAHSSASIHAEDALYETASAKTALQFSETPTATQVPANDLACLFLIEEIAFNVKLFSGCAPPGSFWETMFTTADFIRYTLSDGQGGPVVYSASLNFQRGNGGEILSYEGTVRGNGFTDYQETIINRYDDQEVFVGADVTKVLSGTTETLVMDVVFICEDGYWVNVNGDVVVVGTCSITPTPTDTPTATATPTPTPTSTNTPIPESTPVGTEAYPVLLPIIISVQ